MGSLLFFRDLVPWPGSEGAFVLPVFIICFYVVPNVLNTFFKGFRMTIYILIYKWWVESLLLSEGHDPSCTRHHVSGKDDLSVGIVHHKYEDQFQRLTNHRHSIGPGGVRSPSVVWQEDPEVLNFGLVVESRKVLLGDMEKVKMIGDWINNLYDRIPFYPLLYSFGWDRD